MLRYILDKELLIYEIPLQRALRSIPVWLGPVRCQYTVQRVREVQERVPIAGGSEV